MRYIFNTWLHFYGTFIHKLWVAFYIIKICFVLLWRALIHDLSKYSLAESIGFIKVIHLLKNSTYGSKEYHATLDVIRPSINHHQQKNRHHPEGHLGVGDMTLVDIVEMLCDWKAATRRHADGNIKKSIEHNETRYDIDPQLASVLRSTVRNHL